MYGEEARETIIHRLVPWVIALRALGVEVEMAGPLLEQAAEHSDSPVTPTMRRGVLSRLEHAADTLRGGRVLWIDDHPEHNGSLISLFRSMGMVVNTARSTAEGLTALRHGSHDLPVVVHAQNFNPERGVDSRIFAGTNNPVEVVHYVIDLMERIRFAAPEV